MISRINAPLRPKPRAKGNPRQRPALRLGLSHFAFFRGHLEALPLGELAERYLETGLDLRIAKRTLDWIRFELITAAKRYARETGLTQSSMTRLLRIDPEKLSVDERVTLGELPDLEEFRAERDPGGFYSESDLILEFEKQYADQDNIAALRIAKRNNRLRRRTNDALKVLEHWLASTPKPADPIDIWLHPTVTRLLAGPPGQATGIVSIEDLVQFINLKGHRWYRRIPGLGTTKAKRVMTWLTLNQVLPVNEFALTPYRQIAHRLPALRPKETGIVPLDHLQLPAALDGSLGLNRSHDPKITAANDQEAIESWLKLKAGDNVHTVRSYRAQAERFLLWSLFEKGKPLSSLTPEDCADYLVFLKSLGDPAITWTWNRARADWIGPKSNRRWHPDWRPFSGTLSASSQRHAVVVLKALCAYLARTRYLRDDPWDETALPARPARRLNIEHVLNARQWAAVMEQLELHPPGEAYYRLRTVLRLLYCTGLRLFELQSLTAKHLVRLPGNAWELQVTGKGGRQREIPIDTETLEILIDYLETRGHTRNPFEWSPALPLISGIGSQASISERRLFEVLKTHFDAAAERIEDLIDASQLRKASTHWLRHTFATEILARGAGIEVAQELLGHADSATTAIYTHASRERKRAAIERL